MTQVRYRVAALALGGLLLGGPLLTNGTASAEQIEAGGRQVVFGGGGVLGLSCRSTPNVTAMTVPADSTVRVVNRTGHRALLRLGSIEKGMIAAGGSTAVIFRRGTTAVQVSPSCALGAESTPVLITATPAPVPTTPDPDPEPTDDAAAPVPPGDADPPSAPGASMPDTAAPATTSSRPQRTATSRPDATRPATSRPLNQQTAVSQAAASVVQTMPQGGLASPKVRQRITRGTAAATPTFAGMPPGDRKTIVPGMPTIGVPTISEAVTSSAAAPGGSPSAVAAAEPVAAMEPIDKRQPVGLLALVAGVLVLGVAIGATRAFVSQRASRATIT